jgi:pSer/pThr/pTyr-binding forkhead associated (FHA) protein
MRPRILVLSGVRAGEEFPLPADPFTIGRDPGADLSITDPIASRRHCVITFEDGQHYIEDEGSQNDTPVNGELITGRRALRHGDRISVGDITLAYISEEGSFDAAAPVHLVDGIPLESPQTIVLERRSALLGTILDVADALG